MSEKYFDEFLKINETIGHHRSIDDGDMGLKFDKFVREGLGSRIKNVIYLNEFSLQAKRENLTYDEIITIMNERKKSQFNLNFIHGNNNQVSNGNENKQIIKLTKKRSFLKWILKNWLRCIVGLIIGVIIAVLGTYFKLPHLL